jgi:hypothetical protein
MWVWFPGDFRFGKDPRPLTKLILMRVVVTNVRFWVASAQVPLHRVNPRLVLHLLHGYCMESIVDLRARQTQGRIPNATRRIGVEPIHRLRSKLARALALG